MSDFSQNGVVCTLQRLNDAHLTELDSNWLPSLAQTTPVSLILPCHAPDLLGPALVPICRELAQAAWIHHIIIPINGLASADLANTRDFFQKHLPLAHTVFQTDTPAATQILSAAAHLPPEQLPTGKGLNVWAAMGLLFARGAGGVFALQDCDVLSFQRASLARLCFPVADPALEFDFAKMYYSRVTDRLYGRVSRLFLAPLLHALIRVAGHHPLLDFLQAFRYPLAGECAIRSSLASQLPIHNGWALEIGMLSGVFRQIEPTRVCQVDGGSGYDHKHQPASGNLSRMCVQIGTALLHQLATEGCTVDAAFLHSVARALQRECTEAVRRSSALARINGIPNSSGSEELVAASFSNCLPSSLPPPEPLLPPWESVRRVAPDTLQRLLDLPEAAP